MSAFSRTRRRDRRAFAQGEIPALQNLVVVLAILLSCSGGTSWAREEGEEAALPAEAGWVIGHVYEATTGMPIEGALVVVEENGAFAGEGRTVSTSESFGRYQSSTDLGRVSTKYNVAGALLGGIFGPARTTTSRIDISALNLRVTKAGYNTFEGLVRCRLLDAQGFRVFMAPVLLTPSGSPEVSTPADGWGSIRIRDLQVDPQIAHPGEDVKVTVRVSCPAPGAGREADSFFARLFEGRGKLHLSVSSTVSDERRSLTRTAIDANAGSIVFSASYPIPRELRPPSQFITAAAETSPVEVPSSGARRMALIQVIPRGAEESAARLRLSVNERFGAHDMESALRQLTELCALPGATIVDHLWMANVAALAGDRAAQAAALRSALAAIPADAKSVVLYRDEIPAEKERWELRCRYAGALLEDKQAAAALEALEPEVGRVPETKRPEVVPAEALVAIARAQLALGDLKAAAATNDALSKWKDAQQLSSVQELGADLQFAQAEKAAQDDPGSATRLADLARLLLARGQWEDAAGKFRAALQCDPGNTGARCDLTYTLLHLPGSQSAVAEELDTALASAKQQVGPTAKAEQSSRFEDWHEYAILLYAKADRQRAAREPAPRRGSGWGEAEQGRSPAAAQTIADCRAALIGAVTCGRSRPEAGTMPTVGSTGRYPLVATEALVAYLGFAYPEASSDLAILSSLDALAAHPDDYLSWFDLAGALLDLHLTDLSEAALQESLRLRPDFPEAQFAAAVMSMQRGDSDAAIARLQQVVAVNPRHPFAYSALAGLYDEQGDTARAAACRAAYARTYGDSD